MIWIYLDTIFVKKIDNKFGKVRQPKNVLVEIAEMRNFRETTVKLVFICEICNTLKVSYIDAVFRL